MLRWLQSHWLGFVRELDELRGAPFVAVLLLLAALLLLGTPQGADVAVTAAGGRQAGFLVAASFLYGVQCWLWTRFIVERTHGAHPGESRRRSGHTNACRSPSPGSSDQAPRMGAACARRSAIPDRRGGALSHAELAVGRHPGLAGRGHAVRPLGPARRGAATGPADRPRGQPMVPACQPGRRRGGDGGVLPLARRARSAARRPRRRLRWPRLQPRGPGERPAREPAVTTAGARRAAGLGRATELLRRQSPDRTPRTGVKRRQGHGAGHAATAVPGRRVRALDRRPGQMRVRRGRR